MATPKKSGPKSHWTQNEINILKANAGNLSSTEISKLINRSTAAIQTKAVRLGISLDGYCKKIPCIDCGTPVMVAWQTQHIRCSVCREKYLNETRKIYEHNIKSSNFQKIYDGNRNAVLERDGYRCRLCGSTYDLIIHHINEKSYHNSDEPDNSIHNLTTLCNSCHASYHMKRIRNKKEVV